MSRAGNVSVLHIRIVLMDAEQKPVPVARHALLISDNPATTAPRRIVTALDGTADVRLRPGNYTVESDQPVAFQRKAYQWTQTLDIAAGGDTVLELSADNAEIGPVTAATAAAYKAPVDTDPAVLLTPWQDSVVTLWTQTTRASGFVVDARGLVATSQRAVGNDTSIEVQITPTLKVAGRVVVADPVRDVAIVRIDPGTVEGIRTLSFGCPVSAKSPVDGQELFAFDAPPGQPRSLTSGDVGAVDSHAFEIDLRLADTSAGGPVFSAAGDLVGIVSALDDKETSRRRRFRVVDVESGCSVLAAAETKMADAAAPDGTHLPVEPLLPFPIDALKEAAQRRAGGLSPYRVSASDFDIGFITPILTYAGQQQREQSGTRDRSGTPGPTTKQAMANPLADFSNWSAYLAAIPPVLLVRVTPKLVESLWTTVARGAAQTQGVALPPLKHFKPGFSRMQVFCGNAAVTPIHPFRIEQRIAENDAVYEGLHVFRPRCTGPALRHRQGRRVFRERAGQG